MAILRARSSRSNSTRLNFAIFAAHQRVSFPASKRRNANSTSASRSLNPASLNTSSSIISVIDCSPALLTRWYYSQPIPKRNVLDDVVDVREARDENSIVYAMLFVESSLGFFREMVLPASRSSIASSTTCLFLMQRCEEVSRARATADDRTHHVFDRLIDVMNELWLEMIDVA